MKFNVPQNITLDNEVFRGFSKKAMLYTSIVSLISVIIAVIIYFVKGSEYMLFSVLIVLATTTISIMSLLKIDSNLSIVDFIRNMYNFMKSQKLFIYESEVKHFGNDDSK